MFVSKKKYKEAQDKIKHLEKSLAEAQNLKFVFERLTDKVSAIDLAIDNMSFMTSAGEFILPEEVPVYVDDYYGGKVIKQESTPVTILDKKGKATYSQTAKKARAADYILVQN